MHSQEGDEATFVPRKPAPAVDHSALYVSLYIVILAFFILLNTMSTYQKDKAEEVVESVNNAFAFDKPKEIVPEDASTDESGSLEETILDALEEAAYEYISIDVVRILRDGDFIELQLPVDEVFEGQGAQMRPQVRALMGALAGIYEIGRDMVVIRVEVVMDMRPQQSSLGYVLGAADGVAVQRVGVLARYLDTSGIRDADLASGLRPAKTRYMRLRFTLLGYPEGSAEAAAPPDEEARDE